MANIIESLTSNPFVKATLLKQLKNAIRENGIELVTIALDAKGELVVEPYTAKMVLMTETEFSNLQSLLTDEN